MASAIIVDDERHVREALRRCLEEEGFRVVDEAGDARHAVALATMHEPDVVVLDHHMAEGLGVDIIGDLTRASPRSAVVVYTANDTAAVRDAALAAGAVAVIDKAGGDSELRKALAGLTRAP